MFFNWLKSLFSHTPTPVVVTPKPTPAPTPAPTPTPSSSGGKIYGPDLSHYERGANWAMVASDNGFGITKATEGTSYVDDMFKEYKKDMTAALEVCGFYHFFHPSQDPIAQAKHFLATVGTIRPTDFLAIDWEVTDGVHPATQQAGARQFLQYVRQQTGKLPWVYSYASFFSENIQLEEFAQYNIWMAQLSSKLHPPAPFHNVALWQYTFTGNYKGVPHPCDGNVFSGSLDDLKKLIAKP